MAKEKITGSEALMRSLEHEGIKTIFGYPGGAIMPVFDALYDHRDKLNHILVRHEQGAAHAAQGFARVSGEVGVCLVTSGPGATNTITGVADAMIDSTPIVVIAGQVGASLLGTDAFQEVDLVGITQPISKWSYQIRRAEDVAWAVSRAFYIARSGRPGPVVLDFAKNAQQELTEYEPVNVDFIRSYDPDPETDPKAVAEAVALINEARKPLVLVGQGVELGNAQEELRAFVEKADLPCGCTLLGLSALPSDHRLNKGMLGMHGNLGPNVKTNECDVLIAVGMRFDDRVTGKLETYARQAKVIHLDVDPSEISKNVAVDVPILGNCKRTLALLTKLIQAQRHTEWIESFRPYEEKEYTQVIDREIHPKEGPLNMGEVVRKVSEATRNEAILVTDVGQNQMMACRYFKFTKNRSVVTSGGMGTMGYSIPAAMGAKYQCPEKEVVAVCGDGSFQMSMMELATMRQHGIRSKVIVLRNNYLGMVRQYQHFTYEDHYSVVDLTGSPDLSKIAAAYDMPYYLVEKNDRIEEKLKAFLQDERASLMEVVIDPMDLV
mgnify:CR=1 FL=1